MLQNVKSLSTSGFEEDKTSGFLRSRSLASLTWAGLIRLSEDEGQRYPNNSIPAPFTVKLEAGPGPKCSLTIVLEVSSHRCQPPPPRPVSRRLSHGSMMTVGMLWGQPSLSIEGWHILTTNQQLIKSLVRRW